MSVFSLMAKLSATVLVIGLIGSSATPTQKKAEVAANVVARGRIAEIQTDAGVLTLTTKNGKEMKLNFDDKSTLRLHNQPAEIGKFKKGDRVRVVYESRDGKNHVLTLSAYPLGGDEIARDIKESLQKIKTIAFQQKEQYSRKLEDVMQDLDELIEDVRERAEKAGEDAKKKYEKELIELRIKRAFAEQKLARVKASGSDAWEEIKAGVNEAIIDLQEAYERARAKIK